MHKGKAGTSKNSTQLMVLLFEQTRAMGSLRGARFGEPEPGRASFEPERYEAAQAEALRPLLECLTPDADVFNRILASRSHNALSLLFDLHGHDIYRAIHDRDQGRTISFGTLVKSANFEMLRGLHRAGFSLQKYAGKMIAQAARQMTPDYLFLVRNELGITERILDHGVLSNTLDQPREYILCDLFRELTAILADPQDPVRNLLLHDFGNSGSPASLRISALCLWGVPDMGHLLGDLISRKLSARMATLVEMTTTNHGRLELRRKEPCLMDLLRRPRNGVFFGLSAHDFHKAN